MLLSVQLLFEILELEKSSKKGNDVSLEEARFLKLIFLLCSLLLSTETISCENEQKPDSRKNNKVILLIKQIN